MGVTPIGLDLTKSELDLCGDAVETFVLLR